MTSFFDVLGLSDDASAEDIEAAYSALKGRLEQMAADLAAENAAKMNRIKQVIQSVEKAHERLQEVGSTDSAQREADPASFAAVSDTHPRLGQLCVTSGIITVDQLAEAVDAQIKSGNALGEILQDMQFITQAELDGLLLGQQMIDVPSGITDSVARHLVSLNLITEDMALIAQIERKSSGRSLKQIIQRHGWVDSSVLDAVLPN